MNNQIRFATAVVAVSILVVGGIAILRPSLGGGQPTTTPTPTVSPSSSPLSLLPLAPGAWCRYVASLEFIGAPGGPALGALEKAASGDLTDWKRLGPAIATGAQNARRELQGLIGLAPVAAVVDREATTLDAWIAALQASFADDAGTAEIDVIYSSYYDWQNSRSPFVNAMRTNFETACP